MQFFLKIKKSVPNEIPSFTSWFLFIVLLGGCDKICANKQMWHLTSILYL